MTLPDITKARTDRLWAKRIAVPYATVGLLIDIAVRARTYADLPLANLTEPQQEARRRLLRSLNEWNETR